MSERVNAKNEITSSVYVFWEQCKKIAKIDIKNKSISLFGELYAKLITRNAQEARFKAIAKGIKKNIKITKYMVTNLASNILGARVLTQIIPNVIEGSKDEALQMINSIKVETKRANKKANVKKHIKINIINNSLKVRKLAQILVAAALGFDPTPVLAIGVNTLLKNRKSAL